MFFFNALKNKVSHAMAVLISLGLMMGVNAEPLFQFHTLNKPDGLSSSVVYDVAEDSDGFIWFGTEDGLQKYDGFELTTFRHSRVDQSSISNNIVRIVFVDKSGQIWLGTDNGLNKYLRSTENFERVLLSKHFPSENGVNRIRTIFQSSNGTIWVGTIAGLVKIDQSGNFSLIKSYPVRTMFEDDKGQVWVGTLYGGVYKLDRELDKLVKLEQEQRDSNNSQETSIVDIKQDSFGRILVATWGSGVYTLNANSRKIVPFDIGLPSKYIRSIHQDESGKLWFATNEGVVVYDSIAKSSNLIESNDRNKASLISENITKIYQSSDNTIWVATYGGGVSRHFPHSRRFESYGLHSNKNDGLIDPVLYSLHEGIDNNIWVGSEYGKLSRLEPESGKFTHFPLILDGKEIDSSIRTILELDQESLLIGTSKGVFLFNLKSGVLKGFTEDFLSLKLATEFISLDFKKRIWVGVKNKGVRVYDKITSEEQVHFKKLEFHIKDVKAIYHVNESQTLIASTNNGLFKINLPNSQLEVEDAVGEIELVQNTQKLNIYDVSRDWKGRIWLATWSNGIKIISEKNQITHLDELNGLPNNSVYAVVPDINSKKIWASTNYGIVSINPETLDVAHFTSADGLQSDEFNRPALLSTSGYLYFGGVNGLDKFYPNIVENILPVNQPSITELSIANEKMEIGVKGGLSRSISMEKSIQLNYEQSPFSIKFTSPQYIKPEELQFRYRLKGLDESWLLTSQNQRQATYTNVGYGTYQFQLQVRSKGGSWGDEIKSLDIQVLPPWWLSLKYKIIYTLIIVFVLSASMIMFINKRKREISIQKEIQENEERLKLSLWGSGYEFWDWNIITGDVSRSDEIKKISIDCPALSKNLNELASYIHPEDLQLVREKLSNHIAGNSKHFDMCYRIIDAKRGWRWIQDRAKVVSWGSNGEALRMSGTQRDITDIRERDAQFEMLGQAFKSTSDGVWIRDNEWRLVECNPAFERISGFSLNEKRGEVLWFPQIQEQPENLQQRIRLSIDEKGSWQGEVWAERKNSAPFPQKLSIDTLHDEQGNVRYYVGVFTDITFHKRTEEEFRKLANYDSLTGLPNRACLYDRLNQTIDKAKRDNKRFAVFLIDIDNFKRINDSLGHSVGDILIRQVSSRLVNCNKEGDTVARIGGDEFVIIMENVRSSTAVAAFAELLLQELNQPIFVKGEQLKLNFSIGITLGPDDAIVAERIMRNADTAMYEAKKSFDNSYRFFSIEFNERAKLRLALENALRKAIEEETLELFYQPKIDLNSGTVVGLEALARWTDKEFGFVSPNEFIPLAEETGLILPLGNQILKMAIKQTKEWVDAGVMKGRTSINLSANQFWNKELAEEISALLLEEELEAHHIELEITESACMQDLDETVKQINVLKDLGISLALDDFGTGYSSLSQLKALPFDTLKVDKSFVDNIEKDKQDARVVKAIIDIAKTMEMNVVIEGVESKSQCEYLWKNRAYTVQGFFFSKPVKSSLVTKLFSKVWHKKEYLGRISNNVTPLA